MKPEGNCASDEMAVGPVRKIAAFSGTVRTLYRVRVTRADGVVIFDGAITDDDHFEMKQAAGSSTRVSLSATAAIEGLIR